jgi:hypothetical protein
VLLSARSHKCTHGAYQSLIEVDEIACDTSVKPMYVCGIAGRARDRQAGKKFPGATKIIDFLLASFCR